jgi:uncharacterized membrane protein
MPNCLVKSVKESEESRMPEINVGILLAIAIAYLILAIAYFLLVLPKLIAYLLLVLPRIFAYFLVVLAKLQRPACKKPEVQDETQTEASP